MPKSGHIEILIAVGMEEYWWNESKDLQSIMNGNAHMMKLISLRECGRMKVP